MITNGEISIPLLKERFSQFNFGSGIKAQIQWDLIERFPESGSDEIALCHSLMATRLAMPDQNFKRGAKLQDHIRFKQMNMQMAFTISFLNKGINLIRNGLYEEACLHFSNSRQNWKLGTYTNFSDCYIHKDKVRDWSDFTELELFTKSNLYFAYTVYRYPFKDPKKYGKESYYSTVFLTKPHIHKDLYLESARDPKVKAGLDYLCKEISLSYLEEWLHHLQFLNSICWSENSTTKENCLISESEDPEQDIARIFIALDLSPSDKFFDRYASRKELRNY